MINDYQIRGNVTAIFIMHKDGTKVEAIIDTTRLLRAMSFPRMWYATEMNGRVSIMGHGEAGETVYLSRWLLGESSSRIMVDFVDHDTLNHRVRNLKRFTKSGSGMHRRAANKNNHSSGIPGVTWHGVARKWLAQLTHNRKNIYLGLHSSIEDAARVVETRRKELLKLEAVETASKR